MICALSMSKHGQLTEGQDSGACVKGPKSVISIFLFLARPYSYKLADGMLVYIVTSIGIILCSYML